MSPLQIVFLGVLLCLYAWALCQIPIFLAGVRHLRHSRVMKRKLSSHVRKTLPSVSIIVPVKDEERVVGRLLEAFLRVDYPHEKMEIVMVEDGSTDGTVETCGEYAELFPGRVKLVRGLVSNGKPSALNLGLKNTNGEIVGVFDADSVPEHDVLLRVAEYFQDASVDAVQGRPLAINADESMLSKFVSFEEAVRYEAYIRGKDVLDLFVPLTGSCYFVRRRVLEAVGGWSDVSLSEDMELSARLVEEGCDVKYASDVQCWQENPASLRELFRQRERWFRGCMEVSLKYGKLLRNLDKRSFDTEVTLFGPFIFVLSFFVSLLSLSGFLGLIEPDILLMLIGQGTVLLLSATLLLVGVALFFVSKPRRVSSVLWLPFVYAYWSVQNLIALLALARIVLKRPGVWKKTVKTGRVTSSAASLRASCGSASSLGGEKASAAQNESSLVTWDSLGKEDERRSGLRISVIVPTKNEESAIGRVLVDIPQGSVDELIVVDGSTDATAKIAEGFGAKVVFEWRDGYGRALQSGIEKSTGDVVVYIDGDHTYDPRDISRIVEPILNGECDVVLGNRLNGGMHPGAMPLLNRLGNFMLSLFFSVVFLRRVHDTQCGLRAIRKRFLNGNSCREYGMPYVTEQLIKLLKQGARIHSAPVAYRQRVGATKLSTWTDGINILRVILIGRIRRSIA